MKMLMIIPAALTIVGFGSDAINPNDLSAEQQTQIEIESDQEFYSNHVINLPENHPDAKIPEELLMKLNDLSAKDA